jgi:hypothetical protein
LLDRESRKSKTRETNDPKPRKGGVSCGTFKRGISINSILSCLYIGVSGGHQRPFAGTLTRLQTGPNAISSSRRGRNGNLIIEEQCENSPQKRAKDNPPNATKKATKTAFSAPFETSRFKMRLPTAEPAIKRAVCAIPHC